MEGKNERQLFPYSKERFLETILRFLVYLLVLRLRFGIAVKLQFDMETTKLLQHATTRKEGHQLGKCIEMTNTGTVFVNTILVWACGRSI